MKIVHGTISVVFAALAATACGGSSSSDASIGGGTTLSTGIFLDSPVINIGYKTETLEGVTNTAGEYDYLPGETVTFFIGDLELPAVLATGVVTPLEIAGTEDSADSEVINIIRLLQTLDADGNPDNGISITDAAKLAAAPVDFDQSTDDFAALAAVTNLIANGGQDEVTSELVDEDEALAHFQEQLDDINGVETSLAGTWSAVSFENELLGVAFFADGTYVHVEYEPGNNNEESGMEWGSYTRNAADGKIDVVIKFDANGDTGLSDFDGSTSAVLYVNANGDQLTATIDEDGNGTIDDTVVFERESSAGIVGTWVNTSSGVELLVLAFSEDGTYVHAEVDRADQNVTSGMEYGTYVRNETTGQMTVTQTFDENGDIGLTDFVAGPAILFVNVEGDTLTAEFDDNGNGEIDGSLEFARQP